MLFFILFLKVLKDDLATYQQKNPQTGQQQNLLNSSSSLQNNNNVYDHQLNGPNTNSLSSISSSNNNHLNVKTNDPVKLNNITNSGGPNSHHQTSGQPLQRHPSIVSNNSSTIYSVPPNERDSHHSHDENLEPNNKNTENTIKSQASSSQSHSKPIHQAPPVNGHKFEVVTFNTIER